MQPQNAKSLSSRRTTGRLILLLGIITLWCAHAYAIWSGTLYYILTRMALFPVILLLFIEILRNFADGKEVEQKHSLSHYSNTLLLLLVFSVCFIVTPLPNYIKDYGIRHHIQTVSNEAKLQAWAEKILQMPFDKLPVKSKYDTNYYLDERSLPDYVRCIPLDMHHEYSYCLVDKGSQGRYLEIGVWRNRPESWGIILCLPSDNPTGLKDRWMRQWKPGLYGWQELNAVS